MSAGWNFALIDIITSLIFGDPPYNMSPTGIGLLGISSLVAGILGFLAGPIDDWLCKVMARRNNGVYEPEAFPHPLLADNSFVFLRMWSRSLWEALGISVLLSHYRMKIRGSSQPFLCVSALWVTGLSTSPCLGISPIACAIKAFVCIIWLVFTFSVSWNQLVLILILFSVVNFFIAKSFR